MSMSGVSPKLSVLYVPDYVIPSCRITATTRLARELDRLFPAYSVALAIAEGPFEDDEGTSGHFDGSSVHGKTKAKQTAGLRNDLHVSIAKLARAVYLHTPKLIIGHGQGARQTPGDPLRIHVHPIAPEGDPFG